MGPGPAAEVGVLPVFTTDAARSDRVFGLAPAEFPALQWHADTFALPAGATRLAHSAAYPEQAFVVARAYALQFHLEVDAGLATAWGEVLPTHAACASCSATTPCRGWPPTWSAASAR